VKLFSPSGSSSGPSTLSAEFSLICFHCGAAPLQYDTERFHMRGVGSKRCSSQSGNTLFLVGNIKIYDCFTQPCLADVGNNIHSFIFIAAALHVKFASPPPGGEKRLSCRQCLHLSALRCPRSRTLRC
jgi:hypothetical protein